MKVHERLNALFAMTASLLACTSSLTTSSDWDAGIDVVDTLDGSTPDTDVLPSDASSTDVPPTPRRPIARLSSRSFHTCFRKGPTEGWCWGSNIRGELGVSPSVGSIIDARALPVPDRAEIGASIVAGPSSTAMITASGSLLIRGGEFPLSSDNVPHPEWAPLDKWRAPEVIVYGASLLCAFQGDRVGCLGLDIGGWIFGLTGDSQTLSQVTTVPGLSRVAQFSVGSSHLCAALDDGSVQCVGKNVRGECGAPPSERRDLTSVVGLPPVAQVAVDGASSCALTRAGEVWCWGSNFDGTLGDGTNLDRWQPVRVEGLPSATSIALSRYGSACAVASGRLYCWGWPIGPYTSSGTHSGSRPVLVPGLEGVIEIALGTTHACALTHTDSVFCWGDRSFGQLGNGEVVQNANPLRLPVAVQLPR